MRRVVLLAVLALALPTAAMANTFDFGNAGTLGTTASLTGSATAGGSITLSSVLTSIDNNGVLTTGNLGTVTVTTGTLVKTGVNTFSFTGGTISVWDAATSSFLFQGTFSGTVMVGAGGSLQITYALNGTPVVGGFQISAAGVVSGDTIVTPEPGTLGLLGTGLVGLAGIVRRKLRG
jgi:PEP-CTERM motif-containing protein